VLSARRAHLVKELLDGLRAAHDPAERIPHDPVELVHLYRAPDDVEVAGLLCASLAYGRVDLFKPVLRRLLAAIGPSPAAFCREMPERPRWAAFEGIVYRFNKGADLACLLWACGEALRRHGSLGALFARSFQEGGGVRGGLERFTGWLRAVDFAPVRRRLGAPRALEHLLPAPGTGGACKRLNLYLRWMIRGPDAVDFGVWRLPPSALVIPLDTHIARMSRNLGLTRRRDLSWRTAEEITAALRLLDPEDPVKYDFALCHYGMSGLCPPARRLARCRSCELRRGCGPGTRLVRLHPACAAPLDSLASARLDGPEIT
jgi:uncharacterized protein (TIGR02757 family)